MERAMSRETRTRLPSSAALFARAGLFWQTKPALVARKNNLIEGRG